MCHQLYLEACPMLTISIQKWCNSTHYWAIRPLDFVNNYSSVIRPSCIFCQLQLLLELIYIVHFFCSQMQLVPFTFDFTNKFLRNIIPLLKIFGLRFPQGPYFKAFPKQTADDSSNPQSNWTFRSIMHDWSFLVIISIWASAFYNWMEIWRSQAWFMSDYYLIAWLLASLLRPMLIVTSRLFCGFH